MSYSDEELLKEIRRVADVTGSDGAPTVAAFDEHSDIAGSTIHRRFGSWNEGVVAAGFDPNPPEATISADDLRDELHRLREALGHVPLSREMDEVGAYSRATYQKRFGSWTNALVTLFDDIESADGLDPRQAGDKNATSPRDLPERFQQHTDEALIEEVRRLAEYHDPPRVRDVREHSDRAVKTYYRRFGSWTAALEAAGFEAAAAGGGRSNRISTDELVVDLHRLRDELGDRPTSTDVADSGAYGLATYQRRFGSWSAAAAVAFDGSDAAAD